MAAQKGAKKGTTVRRRRERKNVDRGAAHIQSTFNNTIVTITAVSYTHLPHWTKISMVTAETRKPHGRSAK